jgi:hypothetical protein
MDNLVTKPDSLKSDLYFYAKTILSSSHGKTLRYNSYLSVTKCITISIHGSRYIVFAKVQQANCYWNYKRFKPSQWRLY